MAAVTIESSCLCSRPIETDLGSVTMQRPASVSSKLDVPSESMKLDSKDGEFNSANTPPSASSSGVTTAQFALAKPAVAFDDALTVCPAAKVLRAAIYELIPVKSVPLVGFPAAPKLTPLIE